MSVDHQRVAAFHLVNETIREAGGCGDECGVWVEVTPVFGALFHDVMVHLEQDVPTPLRFRTDFAQGWDTMLKDYLVTSHQKHGPVTPGAETIPPRSELLARLDEARRLLSGYVDDEECSFDHHGYCQSHAASNPRDCFNTAAKLWLRSNP